MNSSPALSLSLSLPPPDLYLPFTQALTEYVCARARQRLSFDANNLTQENEEENWRRWSAHVKW